MKKLRQWLDDLGLSLALIAAFFAVKIYRGDIHHWWEGS